MSQRARLETAADIADEGCHKCRKGFGVDWASDIVTNTGRLMHPSGRFRRVFVCQSTAARAVVWNLAGKELAMGPTKDWRKP